MAKKTSKNDVFFITDDEVAEVKSEVSQGSFGVLCPKRNKSINEKCYVCDYIQTQIYARKFEDSHSARGWARDKKAQLAWFVNVVLPENPDKSIFLELGSKAGNQIIDGVENKGWRDIVHPHKGVGRELLCTKSKKSGESWPTYTISPCLEKADWEIPEKVWKNVPDLGNVINMLESGELNKNNYMHIKSLKMGETLTFRICPPKEVKVGERKIFIAPIFRHWGVTEDQINGKDSINWKEVLDTDEDTDDTVQHPTDEPKLDLSFTENKKGTEEAETPEKEVVDKTKNVKKKKPSCFGMANFFEDDDKVTCIPCDYFKACGKKVAVS